MPEACDAEVVSFEQVALLLEAPRRSRRRFEERATVSEKANKETEAEHAREPELGPPGVLRLTSSAIHCFAIDGVTPT